MPAVSDKLAPCPSLPICVCSRADAAPRHRVAPLAFSGDPAAAFARLRSLVAEMERTKIVTATDDYFHAECRTRLFRFIDDLECQLSPADGVIHVRSASRAFYALSDSGVNRRRVEALRRRFESG